HIFPCRYHAILHPIHSRAAQSKARTFRILTFVWLVPMVAAVPYLYPWTARVNTLTSDLGTISRLTCFDSFTPGFRRGYFTFLFAIIYCFPLGFITYTCLRIAWCLITGSGQN